MVIRGLRALLEEWMPWAYISGRKARQCVWDARRRGSGMIAKEVAMSCLIGLLTLKGNDAHTVEYVRTLSCALICWSHWHSRVPGCCYADEPNEAALHQLGRWCQNHPEIKSAKQLEDLFLLVPPSAEVRTLPPSSCSRALLGLVVERVRALSSGVVRHVPYVEWIGGGGNVAAQRSWPVAHSFPPTIRQPPCKDHLKQILIHALACLTQQQPLKPRFLGTLQHYSIPTRSPDEALAWYQASNALRTAAHIFR